MERPKSPIRRCAIYTRKSSEEGLEQDFNSLQAQREACEAFIKSQAGEGWRLVKTAYDDGGLSGGTMERPALQRLLSDINQGLIDVVVVYKVVRVACGHIHRPIHVAWGGTIASTSPSTCHQVPLNLAGQDGFEFTMEPRAVQLHVWDDRYGLISHLSYVPANYEEVVMLGGLTDEARAKLLAQNRRDYQELCESEYDR